MVGGHALVDIYGGVGLAATLENGYLLWTMTGAPQGQTRLTYLIHRLQRQTVLPQCPKGSRVSVVRIVSPGVNSNVLGTFVAFRWLIISGDRLNICYVWLTTQKWIDGYSQIVGIRVEASGALAELWKWLGRHAAELIR